MTERLYYTDSYITEFTAEVLDIISDDGNILLIFDKTAFFPGGGGQLCDKGTVNSVDITEVFERDGNIYHRIIADSIKISVGDTVCCSVDKAVRLERMRAHTGEHIVSGVAHNLFGVDNVGFHMDENCLMTVDFNKYLDNTQLNELERLANLCVLKNYEVSCRSYSVEEASELQYRSKIDFDDFVRIVDIQGVDCCACCAPHLKCTAEVGMIKILSSASHRGGVRITLICGMNVYNELALHYRQILNISSLLCSRHNEADSAVEKLVEANKQLKFRNEELRSEFLEYISESIASKDIIVEFFDRFSVDDLRNISNALAHKCGFCSFTLSGNDTVGYSYCIFSNKLNLRKLCKEFNLSLNGSGGGKGEMVQGKVNSTASEIRKFIDEMSVEDYADA